MGDLYKILFDHYSQKDSERGIAGYVIVENIDMLYDYVDETFNCGCWADKGEYECAKIAAKRQDKIYDGIEVKTFRERNISQCGEMFDEDYDLSDLYYGVTLYGWELIESDVDVDGLKDAIRLKMVVVI